jgi:zinc D-Ala-D-Ala carboxypeptidase
MKAFVARNARIWAIALSLGLASSLCLAIGPVGAASTAVSPSGAPLPDCRFDSVPAAYQGYGDWQSTMVDTTYTLPKSYKPPDLVSVVRANIVGRAKVRALVIDDLRSLAAAARAAGHPIAVQSGYRSYATQASTFNSWVSELGYDMALKVSARPGHSEHQLGLAIDFKSNGGMAPWKYDDWGKTPTGRWMAENAWEYGFVLSYPKGESPSITCYRWEPWHYRYVGRESAAAIHSSGLTTREYMWQQGDGEPGDGSGSGFTPGSSPIVASAPTVVIGSNQLTKTGVPLNITWSADDPGDVVAYTLQQSENSGDWQTLSLASPAETSTSLMDQPGHAYSYRVLATDSNGNQSNWAETETLAVTAIPETDAALDYSGDWIARRVRSALGRHLRYASVAGASASYTFTGSSIAWISRLSPLRGVANVYIDGNLTAVVDTYSPASEPRAVAFSQSWAESGEHTITLVIQGTDGRPRVDVDGFVVIDGVEQSQP